jgi:hypothetical protein
MEALRGADSDQRRFEVQRRARFAYSDGARWAFAAGYSLLGFLAAIASRRTTVARQLPTSELTATLIRTSTSQRELQTGDYEPGFCLAKHERHRMSS